MTPEEFRREQRRDAGRAFLITLACMGAVGALIALTWLLWEIPNFGLGG